MKTSQISGRGYARLGFIVGISTSIAANIGHSVLSLVSGQPTWVKISAVGSGAFWPLALLICLEIIARVSWPRGWQWMLTRHFGLLIVAIIAAVVSYRHMYGLLIVFGEDAFTATAGPIGIDGLMLISSVALLAIGYNLRQSAEPEKAPASPYVLPVIPTVHHPVERVLTETPPTGRPEPLPIPVSPGVGPMPDEPKPMPIPARQEPVADLPLVVPAKDLGKRAVPRANPNAQDRREEARNLYLKSVEEGTPMTGKQVGEAVGQSERYGRTRIQEAKAWASTS